MAMGVMILLWSFVTIQMMITKVSAGDEAALLAFKAQVSDGGSLASWNSSSDFCSWEGVTCSRGTPKRAVVLSLRRMALTGALSPALGNLTSLQTLNLSFNGLKGEIPGSLGHLQLLQNLDLSDNQLQGSIPPGLGSMQNIQILQLARNNLSGMLPLSLNNLSSLETFDVGSNMLSGSIPVDIGNEFPHMEVLNLGANHFTGTIPSSLSNLSDLVILILELNRFSGYVPPTLGRLGVLQELYLAENRLEANDEEGWEFITSLANCSKLRRLTLGKYSFGGQLPGPIVNLSTTLQKLYLDDNRISGSIPADIGNLIGLNILLLANNSVSGLIPESIGKLKNLIDLGLYSNSLTGLIPQSVGNLTKLTRLLAYYNNLEGTIPASLGNLENLFLLDLSTNYRLNGSIPVEIFKLPSLSWYLDLSYNSLSGPLPSETGTMTNLNELILSGNQLTGQIPSSIGNCIVLQKLLLDKNSFEGSIPESLGNIKGLNILNLTLNKLSGRIPDAIGSIRDLQQLYLANNSLLGSLPAVLQNLSSLSKFDVSFNNLQSEVPEGGVFRNITAIAIAGNTNLCGGAPQLHLAPCSTSTSSKNKRKRTTSLVISLATTGAILLSFSVILLVWILCKKLKQSQKTVVQYSVAEEHYERIPYHALLRGTNGFSEFNLLGRGSYGAVYKCVLDTEERALAVKVFNIGQSRYSKSFEVECEAMRRIRHRSLIKIITCCSSFNNHGQEFRALVFEFMPNGNLDGWLHPKSREPTTSNTLSLSQRLDIAVDIVDAVEYLHNYCQPLIIHCDLKPTNILLADDLSARVGDFGISRILQENTSEVMQNSYSTTGIIGSIGYVAPEYGEGSVVSTQGDIYSLGIMLLEMFTGRSPTDDTFGNSLDLHKFTEDALPDRNLEVADPIIWLHTETKDNIAISRIQECLVSVLRLGLSCSKTQPRERTLIRDAVIEMHAIRDAYLLFAG